MTTSYPGALDTYTTKTDNVDDVLAAHVNNMQDAIVAVETALGTSPAGSKADLKTRLAVCLSNAGLLQFAASTLLTIAAGVITATQNWHRVDTEAAAAADDLDTITAGADGQILLLRTVADARKVTIRHNIGNILCAGAQNIVLGTAADLVLLVYDAVAVKWIAMGVTGSGLLNGANTWTGLNNFNAAMGWVLTAISITATLDATHHVVSASAAGGVITINLPTAVGISGRIYTIIKADDTANAVTVDASGAETINGSLTRVLAAQYAKVTLISNNVGWLEI